MLSNATTNHHQRPPLPWQFLLAPTNISSLNSITFTPSHVHFRLLAVRSRNFDFGGLNFDDMNGNNDGGGASFGKRRRKRNGKKSKQRRWWSDDEEDYDGVIYEPKSGILEQVVDGVWIFKVLKSYGWFSPAILASLLLASGPKAFLMAFSLPLGFSLVILAFDKLREWLDGKPKRRRRRRPRKRSSFNVRSDVLMEEDDDQEEESEPRKRNWKRDFRSRGASNTGSVHNGKSRSRASTSRFGGWDELIVDDEVERAQTSSPKMSRTEESVDAKMNRSLGEKELPILLRLLVSLFPFLGSLTNLL